MDLQKEREAFEKYCFEVLLMSPLDGHFERELEDPEFYESVDTHRLWKLWQAKAQAVPDGFVLVDKSKIESWYLDDYERVYIDEPDNFLSELDIGSVQAVVRKDYLIINEQTLYAARPWNKNDETADCWEFYESKAEADLVAESCLKNWNGEEAQEQNHD